jgi:hypothetical protein
MENLISKQWVNASTIEYLSKKEAIKRLELLRDYYPKEKFNFIEITKTINNKWIVRYKYLKTL